MWKKSRKCKFYGNSMARDPIIYAFFIIFTQFCLKLSANPFTVVLWKLFFIPFLRKYYKFIYTTSFSLMLKDNFKLSIIIRINANFEIFVEGIYTSRASIITRFITGIVLEMKAKSNIVETFSFVSNHKKISLILFYFILVILIVVVVSSS